MLLSQQQHVILSIIKQLPFQQQNSNKSFRFKRFMGQSSSKGQTTQISTLSKNLLIQLAFPKVGQKFQKAEFFYKTRQMKIHIPLQNQTILNQWTSNLQIFKQENIKNYILLPKCYQFQKQGYCGSGGIAKIVYDYFPYSLEGQIENRKKSIDNQEFSQPQIWKILFTLLKAANFMHQHWKKLGDIRPKNIFYNEQKELRVSCKFSYPHEMNNFQKFVFEKQISYLAPQELHDIIMGRLQPLSSRNTKQHIIEAESWSIGLTMLHIALAFNFEKIYDPIKNEINIALLQQKIGDFQKKKNLSEALKNIIKSLLQQIPERRLLCSQLISTYLLPFQESIAKLEAFDKTKLNMQIKQLMTKKSLNSLVGTIWKACQNGLIQSLVFNKKQNERLDTDARAKETLMHQLQKFSQIQPKNSQVSIRQSIRLGHSRKKMTQSNVNYKHSQVSSESFHTVGSLQYTKKDSKVNKIIGLQIQNRFVTQRYPTTGSNLSPPKNHNFDNMSDKFMTPLQQSSYFHTIHQNQRSFDFNSLGLLNSSFRNSQTIEDKNFLQKIYEKIGDSKNLQIEGNFKKEKSKQKK